MESYNGKRVRHTAEQVASSGQVLVAAFGAAAIAGAGLVWGWSAVAAGVATMVVACFAVLVLLKGVLHVASRRYGFPADLALPLASDQDLPTYTIFAPLYKEGGILPQLVRAIDELRYPKDRLQVLLLVEEEDTETRDAAAKLRAADRLPDYFETIVVPDGQPRTKPRACNVGMLHATGEYCVIYDAEDRPEPDQLLKAVATFRYYAEKDQRVQCLQAKLEFWNTRSSWVTRLYAVDYYVHFNWVLPGLAKLGIVPPLGGTSNHFRTQALRDIAIDTERLPSDVDSIGAWDPFNVTEDAELGLALATRGMRVAMLDSRTLEEATAAPMASVKQRSRWLKGYIQTGLAGTRDPVSGIRALRPKSFLVFNLMMLGTPLAALAAPIFWAMTAWYYVARPPFVEGLYTGLMLDVSTLLLIIGTSFAFFQQVSAGLALRARGASGVAMYAPLMLVWWLLTGLSAGRAVSELVRPSKRHGWAKTQHGHDALDEGLAGALAPAVA